MASGGGGGIPWKPIFFLLLYILAAYAIPQLRPANIAHSLAIFAENVRAGQAGG